MIHLSNTTGENNPNSVLTVEKVLAIRAALEATPPKEFKQAIAVLAEQYGVAPETISRVYRRKCWRHV